MGIYCLLQFLRSEYVLGLTLSKCIQEFGVTWDMHCRHEQLLDITKTSFGTRQAEISVPSPGFWLSTHSNLLKMLKLSHTESENEL